MRHKRNNSENFYTGDLVFASGKNKAGVTLLYPAILLNRYFSDTEITYNRVWNVMYIGNILPYQRDRFATATIWSHINDD